MMMEFAWVSYWFPNAGTGAFYEYFNAVYIATKAKCIVHEGKKVDPTRKSWIK